MTEHVCEPEENPWRKVVRSARPGIFQLTPMPEVLSKEDELKFLEQELMRYQSCASYDNFLYQLVKSLETIGSPERFKKMYVNVYYAGFGFYHKDDKLELNAVSDQEYSNFSRPLNALKRFKTVYLDEDTDTVLELLNEQFNPPPGTTVKIMAEKSRSVKEEASLLAMQVAWLRDRNRKERKAQKKKDSQKTNNTQPVSTIEIPEPEVETSIPLQEPDRPALLSEWEVFWTTRRFSTDPNHLIRINTDDQEMMVRQISTQSRGQISISPSSIANALEFHLRRDIIKKALAMRNKYLPEYARDWIKLKRGKDRIMLYTPQDQPNQLYFFAAGRDTIYRGF